MDKRIAGIGVIFVLFAVSLFVVNSYISSRLVSSVEYVRKLYATYMWDYNADGMRELAELLIKSGDFYRVSVYDEFGKLVLDAEANRGLHPVDRLLIGAHLIPKKEFDIPLDRHGVYLGTLSLVLLNKAIYIHALNFLLFLLLAFFWLQRVALSEAKAKLERSLVELKRAEEILITSEKMASLGRLVANISHDMKTPLGVAYTAVSHLGELKMRLENALREGRVEREELEAFLAEVDELVDIAESNLKRVSELINGLKRMAYKETSDAKVEVDLCLHLKEIFASLSPLLKKHRVQLRVVCDEGILLETMPGAVSQIITNLVENSLEHGFTEEHWDRVIEVKLEDRGDWVVLVYRDNGRGMSEEVKRRIFEPFFTTAPPGKGTGLGMSIVYNLTKSVLKGEITVESEPGRGVIFTIVIPKQEWRRIEQ